MRFLCLYKSSKPEGVPPTQQEMAEMVACDGLLIAFRGDGQLRAHATGIVE